MKKIVVLLILCILSFPFFATDVLQCNSDTMSLVVESDVDAEPICQQQEREEQEREEQEREEQEREEKARQERERQEQKKEKEANRLVGELFGQSENGIASKPSLTNPSGVTMPVRRCLKFVKPKGNFPQSGEVVLRITVDEEGDVIKASVGPGTTISDQETIQAAKKAAMATKFSRGEIATGTITYIFK